MNAPAARDWRHMNAWIADLLKLRTGDDVATWNARVRESGAADEPSLGAWLAERGVTGYPQNLLVMERFGYPGFLLASADELIDGQYADRPSLRPILDALLLRAAQVGEVTIQARKTYVSLLTTRRTFATIQPTNRRRVELGLRLATPTLAGRLQSAASMGSGSATTRIPLSSPDDDDDEVNHWLRRAFDENV